MFVRQMTSTSLGNDLLGENQWVIGLRQPALLQWNSLALPPGDAVQC
jgi:hypothetical protein